MTTRDQRRRKRNVVNSQTVPRHENAQKPVWPMMVLVTVLVAVAVAAGVLTNGAAEAKDQSKSGTVTTCAE